MKKQQVNNKKPIVLIINDTHLTKNNYELIKNIFQQAIDLCLEKKINKIFHNGDFFHSRESQPLLVLKEAKGIFLMIKNAGIKLYIIPGNHDRTQLESEDSYLDVFDNECFLIRKEYYEDFGDLRVHWLPYFLENGSYKQRLNNILKELKRGSKNILNTHIGISGICNNDGSVVDNNIKTEMFDKFFKIFVAHYHDQQDYKNIFYTGSSHQNSFGEDNLKGFTLLFEDGSHEFIKSQFPEFIKQKINIDNLSKKDISDLAKQVKENNVRIILEGDKTKLQAFNKQNLQDLGIDVKFEADDINTNIEQQTELVQFDRSNIKEAFNSFCELNEIEEREIGDFYLDKILN